jgi:hypothetical protein
MPAIVAEGKSEATQAVQVLEMTKKVSILVANSSSKSLEPGAS